MVLLQPAVTVEEEELLAPQHPGDRLTHHLCRVRGHRRRGHRAIEIVRLLKPGSQDLVKLLAKARCVFAFSALGASARRLRRSRTVADWRGPTTQSIVCRNFRALLSRVHRALLDPARCSC